MKKLTVLLVTTLLFIPITKAKTIDHSYASVGSDIELKDDVNGTSAIAGDNISSYGNISGANFMAGNNIDAEGTSDYLAVAGNVINIKGTIKYDGFIAGNIINLKNPTIERDLIIAGSDVEVSGNIGRNLTIYAGKVTIKQSNVKGNVRIIAEDIKLEETTKIEGSLSYPKEAKVKNIANIKNIIETNEIFNKDKETFLDIILNKIWSVLSMILIFSLLTLFIPTLFEKIDKKYETLSFNKVIETFSKGLVFLIIVPALSIFLLVFPFSIALSLIMAALYIIIIYLSKIFTAYLIGYKLWQKYIPNDYVPLISGLIGFTILFILDCIPIINTIVLMISMILGIGIIIDLYKKEKIK